MLQIIKFVFFINKAWKNNLFLPNVDDTYTSLQNVAAWHTGGQKYSKDRSKGRLMLPHCYEIWSDYSSDYEFYSYSIWDYDL
jgi:hypothetical protein